MLVPGFLWLLGDVNSCRLSEQFSLSEGGARKEGHMSATSRARTLRLLAAGLLTGALLQGGCRTDSGESTGGEFVYDSAAFAAAQPWTSRSFNTDGFQFAIIGDRTGGANALRTFELAMDQLNLLQPEFVINVGDLIEGYSDDAAKLNVEWNEVDALLARLDMPFFRTPGNHDIANEVAQQVWRERHGATYYDFVYKDVLFLVLDSEDPPRAAPDGMEERIEEYNRLQTEDPARAQAMLAEFMADESVVAALGVPVEFNDAQLNFVSDALDRHDDVRWTFVFLHEPAWENPSESFKGIQQRLANRDHTFFAGHLHYYDYDEIDGREYVTMGPAGASFHHEGPGNVDHISWVTMTEDGPQIANIALKGLFDRKGLDPEMFGAYDRKGAGGGGLDEE
jgi:hypothetical protein